MKSMTVVHLAKAALLCLVLMNWPDNVANRPSIFKVKQFCQIVPGRNYCQNPKSPNSTNCVPLKIYDRDDKTPFLGPPCPKTCVNATLFMKDPDKCISPPDNACVVYDLKKCKDACPSKRCSTKRYYCWSQYVQECPSPDDENLIVSKVYFVGNSSRKLDELNSSSSSSWIIIVIGAIALIAIIALIIFTYIYYRRKSSRATDDLSLSSASMQSRPNSSSIVSQTKANRHRASRSRLPRLSASRLSSGSGFQSKSSRSGVKSSRLGSKPTKASSKTHRKRSSRVSKH